jgi:hypothetical protein
VPATAVSGPITVTNAGGSTNSDDFAVTPVITSFTPASGAVGATVTLKGTGFVGADHVAFGDVNGTPTVLSATSMTAVVPNGASSGPLEVHTSSGGWSAESAASFTVTATLSSFSPSGGAPGTSVTITGVGFTDATVVSFGGTAATTFHVDSDTQITATVPDSAADGAIAITRPTAPMSLQSATSFLVPTISGLSPTTVTKGDDLEIDGTHLDGATTITFGNGATATPFSTSPAAVHVHVPGGAGSGHITVTTKFGNGVTSSGSVTVQYTWEFVVSGGTAGDEVTTDVGGIACFGDGSGTCTMTVEAGTQVTLTATPAGGDSFVWWNGGPFFEVSGNPYPIQVWDNATATSLVGPINAVFHP